MQATTHVVTNRNPISVKAVLFDLDDTLCDDTSAWLACARKAAKLASRTDASIDSEALANEFLDISYAYWFGDAATQETRSVFEVRTVQWQEALANIGREPSRILAERLAEDYGKRRSKEIDLYPDAVSTLTALRELGICVAILSNGFSATHVSKVENLGLNAHVDHVILAEVVGYFKPDARIFRHALELCGCDASEAVMVGDNLISDIAGAEAAGIRSFWFNPGGMPLPDGATAPSGGQIRTLSAILSRVA